MSDEKLPTMPTMGTKFAQLSEREKQVAQLIAHGKTNGEIAAALSISPKTYDTHRLHIMRKLNVRNNVELTRLAISEGVVDVD